MSILTALTALFLSSGPVIAQISATDCSYPTAWGWTYNSLNQGPCKVAAYLQSTCNGGSFTVRPLLSGQEYFGPNGSDNTDLCKCNAVVYSLVSACGACQAATWIDWPQWAENCTTVLAPGSFPNPVPQGTRVPQWALADVTREGLALWDMTEAEDIGDSPEIGPGALIGGSNSTGPGPTGTNFPNPTFPPGVTTPATSLPSRSSLPKSGDSGDSGFSTGVDSHTGAIVGGVVGGGAAIAIAFILFGLIYRQRQRSTTPPPPYMVDVASQPLYYSQRPLSDAGTPAPSSTAETPVIPMRVYDPNDATTFPGYQRPPHSPDFLARPPFSPYNRTENTMVNVPHGYNGLPTV